MILRILIAAVLLSTLAGAGYGVTRLIARSQPLPRATALIEAKDPRGAQLILRPLVRAEPRNAEAHLLLARTQLDLNDPVAAEKELKIARALRYERAIVNPLLARAYIMQQRYQELLAEIPGTVARDEEQIPNLAVRATAYVLMNDPKQAALTLEPALSMAPEDPLVLIAHARLLIAQNDPARGRAVIDKVLARSPGNTEALMVLGDALAAQGDAQGALDVMGRAVAGAPFLVAARLQRANHLMSMGRNKEAQQDVDACFEVDWHDPGTQLANAVLMIRAGRLGDAAVEFQRMAPVLDRFPKGYYWQALTQSLQDHNESALEMIVRYLKLAPLDLDSLALAGALEAKLGRPERAIEYFVRATEAGLRTADTYDQLGRAYFLTGRVPQAVESFRRATSLEPGNKDYAAHLAAAEALKAPPTR